MKILTGTVRAEDRYRALSRTGIPRRLQPRKGIPEIATPSRSAFGLVPGLGSRGNPTGAMSTPTCVLFHPTFGRSDRRSDVTQPGYKPTVASLVDRIFEN